jgi:antitoxin HicB
MNKPTLEVRFFKTDAGSEPVRDWLRELSAIDRKTIGEDIKTVQFGWPIGMPLVRKLDKDLWGNSDSLGRAHCQSVVHSIGWQGRFAARVCQEISNNTAARLEIGKKQNEERIMKAKNIGSSFDDFLAEEAMLDEVTAVAVKRVIAWQIDQEMKAQNLTKTSMAKKMHTSRAALNRLLDTTDTSLTLTTLSSAATVLGKKLRIELESVE